MSDTTNPLLANLKLPGRIFQLPSRGIFYKNGELADNIKEGELHIHPMSALDEINMKNPDQLFSGAAVNTVFKQCISGVEKPAELLSKDVDAIMVFLRTVTYGAGYEFSAKHGCEGAKDHSYVADIDQMIDKMKMIDPTTVDAMYTVSLPNGQVVKLRPNRYQQVLDLIRANENKKEISAEDQQKNLVQMLMGVIQSVDGLTDIPQITEWVTRIPSPYVNRIAEKIENLNEWGPSLRWTCNCKDCGKDYEVEIPINPVSFFTE
jgi:hypothetical protein